MKWRFASSVALLLVWSTLALGQVTLKYQGLKDKYEQDEPIIFKIEAGQGIPDGAMVRGGVTGSDLTAIQVSPNRYHVWAKSGKRTIEVSLVWVLTRDVTVGEETFPVLVDFGQYEETQTFTVGGGDDPPPPPPNDGPFKIWFVETGDRTNLPAGQRNLLASLVYRQRLEALGHDYQETLFPHIIDSPPDRLSNVARAVREASVSLPAVVLEDIQGGAIKVIAMPADYETLAKELDK